MGGPSGHPVPRSGGGGGGSAARRAGRAATYAAYHGGTAKKRPPAHFLGGPEKGPRLAEARGRAGAGIDLVPPRVPHNPRGDFGR